MTRLEFPKLTTGHYSLPVVYHVGKEFDPNTSFSVPYCLVDLGSTKCLIPKTVNENVLKLPISDTNKDVDTGKGKRDFDVVVLPRMGIASLGLQDGSVIYRMTELEEFDVEAWLGDDDEEFILGMNFLGKFRLIFEPTGRLVIERAS